MRWINKISHFWQKLRYDFCQLELNLKGEKGVPHKGKFEFVHYVLKDSVTSEEKAKETVGETVEVNEPKKTVDKPKEKVDDKKGVVDEKPKVDKTKEKASKMDEPKETKMEKPTKEAVEKPVPVEIPADQ